MSKYFRIIDNDGSRVGRFSGKNSEDAAIKAFSYIISNNKKNEIKYEKHIYFTLETAIIYNENTTEKKKYYYVGTQEKLETPEIIKIEDPSTGKITKITKTIKNIVKKVTEKLSKFTKFTKNKSKQIIDNKMDNDEYKKAINKLKLSKYPFEDWMETYRTDDGLKKVKLIKLVRNEKWKKIFEDEKQKFKKQLKKLDEHFNELFEENPDSEINIFPYPQLVFSAFNLLNPKDIKICILGQDPYIGYEISKSKDSKKKKMVPQAMGLSFSVPKEMDAKSLTNIRKNLLDNKHIEEIPEHGNLVSWLNQGVFLLNMALTTEMGVTRAHLKEWEKFTDSVIKYLSDNFENLVFILWGSPAEKKLTRKLIDPKKHKVLVSSHPSPLSFKKPLGKNKPFYESDHFGEANKYLEKHGKEPIDWNN